MLQEYLPPNKAVLGIRDVPIDVRGYTPNEAADFQTEIENSPQLYYCDVQIPLDAVSTFKVDTTGFLPTLSVTFTDRTNIMSDAGLPGDDYLITLRLPARSSLLSFVHMDFKILKCVFDDADARTFHLECVCNVNGMLVSAFKSWPSSTSWEVLKSIANECGLGFRSNVASTSDKMTWINPNMPFTDFVKGALLPHAWGGEASYMWAYVDLYYNLTYVDVEKALQEDAFANVGVVGGSSTQIALKERDQVGPVVLTTDPAGQHFNSQFIKPRITNVSTATSIANGYVRDAYFYDRAGNWAGKAGSFMQFSVDSITSPGAEATSLILKGRPGENKFVAMNRGAAYAGRIDTDNVYPDYAYATVQNAQNLADLQKVSIMMRLPQPNMNLYRFMKVSVVFSDMARPGANKNLINERTSGQWLVTGLVYTYSNANKLEQHVQAVKRELNVKDLSL